MWGPIRNTIIDFLENTMIADLESMVRSEGDVELSNLSARARAGDEFLTEGGRKVAYSQ